MTQRPEFHVHRLAQTDCDGVMEIVPIAEVELGTTMPRRSVFRAGLTVASAIAALPACNDTTPKAPETTIPPLPSPPPGAICTCNCVPVRPGTR
jgi:hypothetical protein